MLFLQRDHALARSTGWRCGYRPCERWLLGELRPTRDRPLMTQAPWCRHDREREWRCTRFWMTETGPTTSIGWRRKAQSSTSVTSYVR